MSGPWGVLTTGFVAKTAVESKADFDQAFKDTYGASLGSNPDGSIPAATSIGQEIAILADSESGGWEANQAIYAGFDPDQAVFPQLDILCALTGTFRKPAAYSTIVETCTGSDGTVLPVGRVVTVRGLGTRFVSLPKVAGSDPNAPNATIQAVGTAWANSTAYALNALVFVNSKVWQATVPGVSAAMGGGPSGAVGSTQTDGTVTWYGVCLSSVAVALLDMQAEDTGPLSATVGQLVTIATPVSGWTGAYNALAATEGRDLETDAALRVRRVAELQAQGGGPPDAIRADILAITEVTNCLVFVNKTNAVVDGVPAHGVEVLIQALLTAPTTNAELELAVWKAVGAGTATGGNITGSITDASGQPQTVSFSRPVEVPIYVSLTVRYDASVWTGVDAATSVTNAVKAAIMNFALGYAIGTDVRSSPIAGAVLDGPYAVGAGGVPILPAPAGSPSIPGLVEVRNGAGTDGTLPYIGTGMAPVTSTFVAIAKRELATISDPAQIVVTATSETP